MLLHNSLLGCWNGYKVSEEDLLELLENVSSKLINRQLFLHLLRLGGLFLP